MSIEIALIGNPNSGKTTLFNALTGTYQKTGNWTGVTTEGKTGNYKYDKNIRITDLPGLYALRSDSPDERVVLKYLKKSRPNVIINIVDGTNLERNLFLTTELLSLGIPTVIAVNMIDELNKNGIKLDERLLSERLGMPVVSISALKNVNIGKLIKVSTSNIKNPLNVDFTGEKGAGEEEKRYSFIENLLKECLSGNNFKSQRVSEKIDRVLMHGIWGLPIFFAVITLVYFLSINIGGFLGGIIDEFFSDLSYNTKNSLLKLNAKSWVAGLFCDSIIKGVGSVLSFLPQVLILFALLTVIEQSGYASRIAFILDRFLSAFGLGGKSFIPMMVCCGCTVTGISATRTIQDKNERVMTIYLSTFMPCGAKMAVFGWFSNIFFGGSAILATSTYFLSILTIAIMGRILKKSKRFSKNDNGFILEIPTLRIPSIKDVLMVMWEKTKDFTAKAGTVIFLVSVALWLLTNFGFSGYTNGVVESSFLYLIGNGLKFIFYPLGFFNWQTSVAVLTGMVAKEAVIETLEVVSNNPLSLFSSLWSVYSFMAFVLLGPPCFASLVTAKKELKDNKAFAFMLALEFFTAYIVAFTINGIGFLLQNGLILYALFGIIIIVSLVIIFCATRRKNKKEKANAF